MLGNAFHPFTTLQECNLDWILTKVKNILRFVPDDGTVGQILRRTRDGAEWSDESQSGAVDSVNGQTGEVVLTKSDIGLGNVDNVQQYSASNPPPYPVTSVNGQTGDVTVSGSGAVDSVNGQTGEVVLTKSDIGLGNVDNVQQYSASNPPPYPVTSILDAYPVGSIYISTHNTDPSILFGGTWTKLEDTFLLATGPTYSPGSRGGEASHTLTINEMPEHNHTVARGTGTGTTEWGLVRYNSTNSSADTTRIGMTGGGQAHNNMPPYLAVYMWYRRT